MVLVSNNTFKELEFPFQTMGSDPCLQSTDRKPDTQRQGAVRKLLVTAQLQPSS